MKFVTGLLSRLIDAFDFIVEAMSALLRVVSRGAFSPDARSLSGVRFQALASGDVLVQAMDINAADREEARRIIMLDPERHLPLASELALFDVAGPLSEPGLRTRPERKFVLGIVRRATLEDRRQELSRARSARIEAFVYAPATHPGVTFGFADDKGGKRRRLRRTTLVAATALVALGALDLARAWSTRLEATLIEADAQRTLAERRVRLLERRLAVAEAAVTGLTDRDIVAVATLSDTLALLAAQQPATTETIRVEINGANLRVLGRTFAPSETELYFRRVLEGQPIAFSAADGPVPVEFEVRVGTTAEIAGRT